MRNKKQKATAMDNKDNKKSKLAHAWDAAKGFTRQHKTPLGISLYTSLLMGTSALATPLINSTIGAGALLAGSLYLLTRSSDVVIDSASEIGKKSGISPLMLGLGLGAMASVPELFVAMKSVTSNMPDIGIGQLVGANIAHVFLILGASAVAAKEGIKPGKGLGWKFNTLAMAGTTAGFGAALATGALTPVMGAGMMTMAGLYVAGNYLVNKKDSKTLNIPMEDLIHHHAGGHCSHDHSHDHGDGDSHSHDHHHHDHEHKKPVSPWLNGLWGTAGMAGLVYSAHLAVDSASQLALNTGVNPATVATLGIALGVSLPELTISVKAAAKGKTDMAVGNVLGCNIFNLLFVGSALGLAGTTVPDSFSTASTLGKFNLAALGTSAGLMSAALLSGRGGIKKWQGYASLGVYSAYVATSVALGGHKAPDISAAALEDKTTPVAMEIVPVTHKPLPKALPPAPRQS